MSRPVRPVVGAVLASAVAWRAAVHRRPRGREVVRRMASRQARPDRAGTAPPVVLVHGLGMSSRSMAALVTALGRTTWALAPDLPGYGRSPRARRGALGVTDLARTLLAWMDEQGVAEAVLVGHSLGAQVVGEAALLAPHRVRRMVLVAPTGDPERRGVLRQGLRLLRGVVHEPPGLVPVALLDYLRAGPGQMVVLMRRAVERDPPRVDVTGEVPLLVVRGSRDRVCRQEWCEQIVAATADSRLQVIEGGPHGVVFAPPPTLVTLLEEELTPDPP